jgi:hypothetical protein
VVKIIGGVLMTESIDKPEPILLKKWQMMEVLSINRNLTACDHAVFWQILDHYNPKLGYAFPPFNRLATRTGFSKRNIENSVNRLVGHGFVEIILHGSQNHVANRYKPNFKLLDDWLEWREKNPNSDLGVWKQSSIGNNLGVWNASSQGMEAQFQSYGSTVPSNPSINPSINEGLIVGLSANATSGATLASPLGGLPLASKDKYKYPEFWNAYPTRKNVGKTEDEITAKLSDGFAYSDIVEGARLYDINMQSKRASWKGDKDYTIHPQNFVKDSRWLDDWTITPKVEVKIVIDVRTDEDLGKMWDDFYDHCDKCPSCSGYYDWKELKPVKDKFLFEFCDIGKSMYYEYWFYNAKTRKLKVKKESNKNELIEAHYQSQKSIFLFDNNQDDAMVRMDKAELNSFHLFK